MRKIIIVLALLFPSISLAGRFQPPPSPPQSYNEDSPVTVQVFQNNIAPQPFVVIGIIHAKGSTEKMLLSKIKSIAKENGADAILNYKIESGTHPSYWTGAVLSNASGVAIKWSPNGISEITDSTSIPVIQ